MEGIRKPEIKIQELLSLLETIEWESDYLFEFNGTNFCIFIISKEELIDAQAKGRLESFEPAEFYAASNRVGWDIYLYDTIPLEDRKRTLFHEILECNIFDQDFSREESHTIALREEQKIYGERKT